ncbi:hypothetical protein FACS1894211_09000 [Clostridia bacterium]|nr:hypothetical protein FACS1894211_09000 [Clostridia bacterium]
MNTPLTLKCVALDSEGRGVCRSDGLAVFVPGVLPGELAEIEITSRKKSFAEARLVKILVPSPDRIPPPCPHAGACGGCSLMSLCYPAQLDYKRRRVSDALARIAKLTDAAVLSVVPCSHPFRYRNKLSLPIRAVAPCHSDASFHSEQSEESPSYKRPNSQPTAGLFIRNTHRIYPLTDCLLQPEQFDTAARLVLDFLRENDISAYDETDGTGLARHLILRSVPTGHPLSAAHSPLSLTLVLNGCVLPRNEALVSKLQAAFPDTFSLWLNVNAARTAEITGKQYIHIGGAERLPADFFGLAFDLHPAAFFQVNGEISARLFEAVRDIIKAGNFPAVIDAYCGAGLLTCVLSRHTRRITGVELSPEAVADARRLAARNGIANAEFIAADCAEVLPGLLSREKDLYPVAGEAFCKKLPPRPLQKLSSFSCHSNSSCHSERSEESPSHKITTDNSQISASPQLALILDPPRSGCSSAVIDAILKSPPALICYISCDPATLARDLFRLKERYDVTLVQPFDMFPQTPHVETLAVLRH